MGIISDIISQNRQIVCKKKESYTEFSDRKGKIILVFRENGIVMCFNGKSLAPAGCVSSADDNTDRVVNSYEYKKEVVYNEKEGKFTLFDSEGNQLSERNVMVIGKNDDILRMTSSSRYVPAAINRNVKPL